MKRFTIGAIILLIIAGFGGGVVGVEAGQYICYGNGDLWANSSIMPWYATFCTLLGIFFGVLPFFATLMAILWLKEKKKEAK